MLGILLIVFVFYFYLYMHHPCNGTLFTWAKGGMIHPVICDGGEITPEEEVADVDCILHSHLYLYLNFFKYLYLHFFMYLHLKFDQYLYLHPPCTGTSFIRGVIYIL